MKTILKLMIKMLFLKNYSENILSMQEDMYIQSSMKSTKKRLHNSMLTSEKNLKWWVESQ